MDKEAAKEVMNLFERLQRASTRRGFWGTQSEHARLYPQLEHLCRSNWQTVGDIIIENPRGYGEKELARLMRFASMHAGSVSKKDVGKPLMKLTAYLRENRDKLSPSLQGRLALDWLERVHGY